MVQEMGHACHVLTAFSSCYLQTGKLDDRTATALRQGKETPGFIDTNAAMLLSAVKLFISGSSQKAQTSALINGMPSTRKRCVTKFSFDIWCNPLCSVRVWLASRSTYFSQTHGCQTLLCGEVTAEGLPCFNINAALLTRHTNLYLATRYRLVPETELTHYQTFNTQLNLHARQPARSLPELQDSSSFGYILPRTQASAGVVAVPLQNQPNPTHISV